MAQVVLLRNGYAHYIVTTNLDGLYRKAGLLAHKEFCCLHGDLYAERCTSCGYEFERNWQVRKPYFWAHNHRGYQCEKCGSKPIKEPDGSYKEVGTKDKNCGTKDTHINFGESLDNIDWNEADEHCRKADLVIVAGTSMTLRHITHFPFLAQENIYGNTDSPGKVVIINLQETPDDDICDLRIFAKTDIVFEGITKRLGLEIPRPPIWRPRDAKPINQIPNDVDDYFIEKAKNLEMLIKMREEEEKYTVPEVIIGNTYHLLETVNNPHKWKIFVTSLDPDQSLSSFVDSVTFQLHPSYTPSTVTITVEPFEVERTGWGIIKIDITILWKNGRFSKHSHELCFDMEISQTIIDFSQQLLNQEPQTNSICLVS